MSATDGSCRQPEGDAPLYEQEEDDNRKCCQCRRGHQWSPGGTAVRGERRQPDRERLLLRAAQQDVRDDVLVPRLDEGEDRRRDEAWCDERQQDPDERTEARRPV